MAKDYFDDWVGLDDYPLGSFAIMEDAKEDTRYVNSLRLENERLKTKDGDQKALLNRTLAAFVRIRDNGFALTHEQIRNIAVEAIKELTDGK